MCGGNITHSCCDQDIRYTAPVQHQNVWNIMWKMPKFLAPGLSKRILKRYTPSLFNSGIIDITKELFYLSNKMIFPNLWTLPNTSLLMKNVALPVLMRVIIPMTRTEKVLTYRYRISQTKQIINFWQFFSYFSISMK